MTKILFLCNRIPNNENAGGILFHNIITSYGINSFHVVSISQKLTRTHYIKEYCPSSLKQFSLRIPGKNLVFKIIKKLPLIEPVFLLLKLVLVRRKLLSYLKNEKFDMIFAPLRGDVLFILKEVLEKKQLPLISMIEDTVEREIDDHGFLYKKKRTRYYEALKMVHNLAVPGETMQGYIENTFNLQSIILRPSYLSYTEIVNKSIEDKINIFFAGNLYAKKETLAFINALSELSFTTEKKEIVIYVASHKKLTSKSNSIRVINLGWLSESALKEYMDICHISYLPYKFEKKFSHSMSYAFPGKAGFYITNNLPIFFHGPVYSSFNDFLKKYQVGVSCSSLKKNDIIKHLDYFINNKDYYKKCQQECLRAYNDEFNNKAFEQRVKDLFTLKI